MFERRRKLFIDIFFSNIGANNVIVVPGDAAVVCEAVGGHRIGETRLIVLLQQGIH
jgi:hypothetical protein